MELILIVVVIIFVLYRFINWFDGDAAEKKSFEEWKKNHPGNKR